MYSFKNNVLSTLLRYSTGSLQDIVKIPLERAVLLASERSFGHELDGIHLRPPDLDIGEGQTRAFNADGLLDDFQPWAGIDKSLHQAEVVARNGFGWPKPDYDVLHGQTGHPMQLRQLHHLVVQ